MNKIYPSLRSVLCIALAFLMLLCVGCVDNGSVDKNKDNNSSDISSDDVNSGEDNSSNYETPTYTYEQNFDDELNTNTNTNTNNSTENKEQAPTTTTSTVTSTVTETISKRDFQLELIQYHPGAPGFDVEYAFTAKFKDRLLSVDDYTISANLDGVQIKGSKVIVPEKVRETSDLLVVTAVYNPNKNYKSQVNIKLKSWSQVWADEFNVDGDMSNWSLFYMGNTCSDANAYVKNGCLNLDLRVEEVVNPDGTTTKRFSRGYVSTQNKYTQMFGCFRAKVLLMDGCYYSNGGIMDSFWLLPQAEAGKTGFFGHPTVDDANCYEIDIFEAHKLGRQGIGTALHFNHKEDVSNPSFAIMNGVENSYYSENKWLDVSFVWTKNAVYTYIDGMLNGFTPVRTKMNEVASAYIIFGSAYGEPGSNSWIGTLEDSSVLPQTYSIDFCRTYK